MNTKITLLFLVGILAVGCSSTSVQNGPANSLSDSRTSKKSVSPSVDKNASYKILNLNKLDQAEPRIDQPDRFTNSVGETSETKKGQTQHSALDLASKQRLEALSDNRQNETDDVAETDVSEEPINQINVVISPNSIEKGVLSDESVSSSEDVAENQSEEPLMKVNAATIINSLSIHNADNAENNAEVYTHDSVYKPLPTYINPRVERYINVYTVKKRDLFQRGLNRSVHYLEMMRRIFREEGLPENLVYLSGVESNFNYRAISRARAVGIWQFMSFTGRDFDLNQSWWHDERYDPEKSTRAAAQYLKKLYKRFDSWELALAAYNSGSGRVSRAIRHNAVRNKDTDYWSLRLPRETRGYVPAFIAYTHIMANLEKYGFSTTAARPEKQHMVVKVPGSVSLKDVSAETKTDFKTLKAFNPALKYQITPGNLSSYEIKLPHDAVIESHDELYASLSKKAVQGWLKHKVRRGDTIWGIARKYDVRSADIIRYNKNIQNRRIIRPGMNLLIPSANLLRSDRANSAKPSGSYKVKKGDTLYKIARQFNTSISFLVRVNDVLRSSSQLLKIGMELTVE